MITALAAGTAILFKISIACTFACWAQIIITAAIGEKLLLKFANSWIGTITISCSFGANPPFCAIPATIGTNANTVEVPLPDNVPITKIIKTKTNR